MGTATTELLWDFVQGLDVKPFQLKCIREDEHFIYLGAVGLHLTFPYFRCIRGFLFSGDLSPDASFRVETVTRSDSGRACLVVVFRQFESSRYQDTPEDIIAGWVPATMADDLAIWMERMTSQLAVLLEIRAARLQAKAEAEAQT